MSVDKPPSFEEPCRIGAERRPFVCPHAGSTCLSTSIPAFCPPVRRVIGERGFLPESAKRKGLSDAILSIPAVSMSWQLLRRFGSPGILSKKPGGEAAGNAAIRHTFRPAGGVPPLLPRRRRIQASLQMLPNSVQQGAYARKYIAAFCELPLIIEYTINQILSTKIFWGNRKARLKPRPSSGMLPSEPCPANGGHGAAAHLLPRTYRCRGLPQKIKAI